MLLLANAWHRLRHAAEWSDSAVHISMHARLPCRSSPPRHQRVSVVRQFVAPSSFGPPATMHQPHHLQRSCGLLSSILLALVMACAKHCGATHSWSGYHWSRASNPVTVKLMNAVTSDWAPYLTKAASQWAQVRHACLAWLAQTQHACLNTNHPLANGYGTWTAEFALPSGPLHLQGCRAAA